MKTAFETYLRENREALRADYTAYKADMKQMDAKPATYREWALEWNSGFNYQALINSVHDEIMGQPCHTAVGFSEINLMQYLLRYNRKIFLFLTCVPYEDVPLYLKQDTVGEGRALRAFAEWRLQVLKR